jgi:hypothetical protein
MNEDKQSNTVYDKDYDKDTWLGKRETSFSTKLLIVAGGVTSFGSVFPLLLSKFDDFFDNTQLFFLLFSIVYFVLPLALFLVWVWFTDRVVKPEKYSNTTNEKWFIKFNKRIVRYPVTYRYWWIIFIQMICVLFYLSLIIYSGLDYHDLGSSFFTILLLLGPVLLAASTFRERKYPNRKFGKGKVLVAASALGVVVVFMAVFLCINDEGSVHESQKGVSHYDEIIKWLNETEDDSKDSVTIDNKIMNDYDKIGEEEKIIKGLNRLEKKMSNLSERFNIKSRLKASFPQYLTSNYSISLGHKDSADIQRNGSKIVVNPKFLVDSLIYGLSQLLLDNNTDWIKDYHTTNQKHRDSCKTKQHERIKKDEFEKYKIWDTLVYDKPPIHRFMERVDTVITFWFDQEQHRYYDYCFINNDSSNLIESDLIAVWLNKQNSEKLNNWIQNMYLPYCQRKAQEEIDEIRKETAWIWHNLRHIGILISLSCLLVLIIFYLELMDLKAFKAWGMTLESKEEDLDRDNLKREIENLNKKAEFLVYPHTLIMTIIAVLLLAVITQQEFKDINYSKSFKLVNMPSLSIPSSFNNNPQTHDHEKKELDQSIKALTIAIDTLTKQMRKSTTKPSTLNETNNGIINHKLDSLGIAHKKSVVNIAKLDSDVDTIKNKEIKTIKTKISVIPPKKSTKTDTL